MEKKTHPLLIYLYDVLLEHTRKVKRAGPSQGII